MKQYSTLAVIEFASIADGIYCADALLKKIQARVILVDGSYDQAFDLTILAADEFGWYCRNTGYNPFTAEGKKTAALEIWEWWGEEHRTWMTEQPLSVDEPGPRGKASDTSKGRPAHQQECQDPDCGSLPHRVVPHRSDALSVGPLLRINRAQGALMPARPAWSCTHCSGV